MSCDLKKADSQNVALCESFKSHIVPAFLFIKNSYQSDSDKLGVKGLWGERPDHNIPSKFTCDRPMHMEFTTLGPGF